MSCFDRGERQLKIKVGHRSRILACAKVLRRVPALDLAILFPWMANGTFTREHPPQGARREVSLMLREGSWTALPRTSHTAP